MGADKVCKIGGDDVAREHWVRGGALEFGNGHGGYR
jgi:hypothetical protein